MELGQRACVVLFEADPERRATTSVKLRSRRSVLLVGVAASIAELEALVGEHWPDVALVGEDCGMPLPTVVRRLHRLRPQLPIVILAGVDEHGMPDAPRLTDAVIAGAAVALRYDSTPLEFASALIRAAQGEYRRIGLDPDLAPPKVSRAEGPILHALVSGATPDEIAEQQGLSRRTVDRHLGQVMRRIGVEDLETLAKRLGELRQRYLLGGSEGPPSPS